MTRRVLVGALGLALTLLIAAPAAGQAPGPAPAAPTPTTAAPVPAANPVAPAAPVPGAEAGTGPQLTGRTEPPLGQRIADSLIWVWLLTVLIGGTAWWVWSGRRRSPTGGVPAAGDGQPDTRPAPPEGPAVRR